MTTARRKIPTVGALTQHVELTSDQNGLKVAVTYTGPGLDRTDCYAWRIGKDNPRNRSLAKRLVAACQAGAALPNPRVRVDNFGHTYVSTDIKVLGRTMNWCLTELGF